MRLPHLRIALSILAIGLLQPSGGHAEDLPEPSEPRLSREEWLANVEAAHARVERMRREGKSFLPPEPAPDEEIEARTRRAFEDESLRPGDVVSTRRGLFQYRGTPGSRRGPEDFVPVDGTASRSRR